MYFGVRGQENVETKEPVLVAGDEPEHPGWLCFSGVRLYLKVIPNKRLVCSLVIKVGAGRTPWKNDRLVMCVGL